MLVRHSFNESCDSDAEDELLSELTDNPGTTRSTKLPVLQMILFSVFGPATAGVSPEVERTLVPPRG